MHSTLYGIRECGYTVPASEPNASVTDCPADGRHACHITGAIKEGREVNTWKEIKKKEEENTRGFSSLPSLPRVVMHLVCCHFGTLGMERPILV